MLTQIPPDCQDAFKRLYYPLYFDATDEQRRCKPISIVKRQPKRCLFFLEVTKSSLVKQIRELKEKALSQDPMTIDEQSKVLMIAHDNLIDVLEQFEYMDQELKKFLKTLNKS